MACIIAEFCTLGFVRYAEPSLQLHGMIMMTCVYSLHTLKLAMGCIPVNSVTLLSGNCLHLTPPSKLIVCTLSACCCSLYHSWCTYGFVNQCSPPVVMTAKAMTDVVTATLAMGDAVLYWVIRGAAAKDAKVFRRLAYCSIQEHGHQVLE